MNHFTVVPAKLEQLNELNALMRRSKGYWGYDEVFLSKFMRIFKITERCIGRSVTKVVYENDVLIGFYSFLQQDSALELDMFFLDPEYIGKGLGRKLWELCLSTVDELGYNSFYLVADPNANSFYEKMGCFKIGEKMSAMGQDRINNIYRCHGKLD